MEPSKKKILLVDDDIDYLLQTRIKLESFDFEVTVAEGQFEAEQIIENFKPDLAILDLMMESDDSGFILAGKIKQKYPDVPVIIATAVSVETGLSFDINSQESRQWIKADAYLEKGIRSDQLYKEINRLTENQ